MKNQVKEILKQIVPYDSIEQDHLSSALRWVESGAEIFRIKKPDVPPKHLVSYFVLVDQLREKILLVDHIKAELWLPSGGHVEKGEHPAATVRREVLEELNVEAVFVNDGPLFLTETTTVGKTAGHTDVSLWYVLHGDSTQAIDYDTAEFNGYKWFAFGEVLETNISEFDPHMHRFMEKYVKVYG